MNSTTLIYRLNRAVSLLMDHAGGEPDPADAQEVRDWERMKKLLHGSIGYLDCTDRSDWTEDCDGCGKETHQPHLCVRDLDDGSQEWLCPDCNQAHLPYDEEEKMNQLHLLEQHLMDL